MGDIIEFAAFTEEPDLESMSREELLAYLDAVRTQIAQLDAKEPKNMNSKAYEAWGDEHEALEDLADEILDLLDEL